MLAMPVFREPEAIRAILRTDPGWAVFALGDLAPGYWEHTVWLRPASGAPVLAMLYRGFATPVLFAMGDPSGVAPLLEEIDAEIDAPALYLHVRPEWLPAIAARYPSLEPRPMWRMVLDPPAFRPERGAAVERLGPGDLAPLSALYADGDAAGEAPGFFLPSMLENGVFFGIREGRELVAAAGTQLVAPREGVAAIGNIYTRRDRRGRGLAGAATSAVVDELLRAGLPLVALNVSVHNTQAVRVYERLGFLRYCEYVEGLARR